MINEENIINTEIPHIEESSIKPSKASKKRGTRIGFNYIILKSLKESQKNDVVKCIYIKSVIDFGICVIKEGTNGDIKDLAGRDIKDRLMWQKELHEKLQDKVRIPRLLGSFEENGNYYLVIERIKGKSLANFFKEERGDLRNDLIKGTQTGIKCMGYLEQISALVCKFHEQSIIHRDVTANNFIITPDGKIAAIDLELSYSLDRQYPSPPFMLGTRGYMSPEQEAASILPTEKEDIYSLGIIILQAWCCISAIKLNNVNHEDVKRKIPFFIPDKELADIVIMCLHPDPSQRPGAKEVCEKITEYKKDIIKKHYRKPATAILYSKDEIIETIQQGIKTLSSNVLYDPEKGWFSENIRSKIRLENDKIDKAWYGSFDIGAAGIIYFLSQAKAVGMDISSAQQAIQKGWDLINIKYQERLEKSGSGLHNGSDGIAAVLIHAIKSGILEYKQEHSSWLEKLLERKSTRLSFTDGLAGQGMASLICRDFLPQQTSNRLEQITGDLLEKQNQNGAWSYHERTTKGFNNGAAGIIYFLLEYGRLFNNKDALQSAQKGLHWLIKEAREVDNTFFWMNSKNQPLQATWCEGMSGIGFTFLRAYQYLKDPLYKKYGRGALVHSILNNQIGGELSQCHGWCGQGEVYLDALAILNEEIWKDKISQATQLIMSLKKVHQVHGVYWLVQNERKPIGNFSLGNSGILHYLLRNCYPDALHMPLMLRAH